MAAKSSAPQAKSNMIGEKRRECESNFIFPSGQHNTDRIEKHIQTKNSEAVAAFFSMQSGALAYEPACTAFVTESCDRSAQPQVGCPSGAEDLLGAWSWQMSRSTNP